MQAILRHIYLERRRLALIGTLSFAAGAMLHSHIGSTRMGLPVPVIAGLIYMVAVVLAAAMTTYFLPGLRRVTDAVAFTRLMFALWVATTQSHELASSPFVSATIVVGGALVLLQLCTRFPAALRKLPLQQRRLGVTQSARNFLGWLDNAAGYHADALTALRGEHHRAHG